MSGVLEDIRRKLEVNNLVVQNQAIAKLSRVFSSKLKQGNLINYKCPELELIWDKSCESCALISDGMCRILICTVVNANDGQADLYNYVINGLTIRIPSARNVNSLIVAVKNLLIMQIFSKNLIKFNLRSPVHPFIHIVQHRPSVWPFLLEQIQSIFNQDTIDFRDAFSIVEPFFRYIFFDPSPSNLLSEFRSLSFLRLVSKSKADEEEMMPFLFQTPFWIQADCINGSIETASRLCDIVRFLIESSISGDVFGTEAGNLLLCLVSHCCQLNKLGIDIESCLSAAEKLAEKLVQHAPISFRDSTILLLGSLMMEVSPFGQRKAIRICSLLLSESRVPDVVTGCLLLPLVTILSIPTQDLKTAIPLSLLCSSQPQAVELLHLIESETNVDSSFEPFEIRSRTFFAASNFNAYASESHNISVLAREVTCCPKSTVRWLEHLKDVTSTGCVSVTPMMLCLLCSLAVRSCSIDEIQSCISVIERIATQDVGHASGLFPLLFYLLKRKKDPVVCLYIYKVIPCFGTHKVFVPPILRFLSALFRVSDIRGFSLRLMCLLWQKQDRVYPHLHKWLVESDDRTETPSSSSEAEEVAIARAASIADVCRLKPKQYGADLLTTLSKIVGSEGSTVSALAIASIATLCKKEVIDLRTTWLFLVRVVGNDERPLVVEKLCELLSLVEDLAVETSSYEQFVAEATAWLWYRACYFAVPNVSAAAFKALSRLNPSCHSLRHLPVKVKERAKIPPEFLREDPAARPEDVLPYVPGSSYFDLLITVEGDILSGCGELFVNLVWQEVEKMPHYILNKSRLVAERQTVTPKSLPYLDEARAILFESSLSECVLKLRGSLALGLLFSFDPPTELDKDGNPTSHSFLKRSSSYRRMLDVLLAEMQLDTNDWHKCFYYPRAWVSFVERTYYALIRARIVQIELHMEHDSGLELTEDPKVLKNNAWLWARDKVADALKEASRGKPTAHGNTVVALAALTGVVVKYFIANGDCDDEGSSSVSEHLAHRHWVHEVCKAFLRILNPGDEPASGTFGWSFATSGASNGHIPGLFAVLLADMLIGMDVDLIRHFLLSLHQRLSNELHPMGQFYVGLGVGFLTAHLVSKNFVDIIGHDAKQLVLQSAAKLKAWCFTDDYVSKGGALLGLAVISTTLAAEDDDIMREFCFSVKEELVHRLRHESPSSSQFGILCFGTSLLLTSKLEYIEEAIELFCNLEEEKYDQGQHGIDIAACRGLLVQYLASTRPESYSSKRDCLCTTWISTLALSVSDSSKSIALIGAYSIVFGNYEIRFIQGFKRNLASHVDTHWLKELTVKVSQFLKSTENEDTNARSIGLWILGSLVLCVDQTVEYVNPSSELSFLDDKSVLKCVVIFIRESIVASRSTTSIPHLLVCLRSLACETRRPYPVVDWNHLLSPLLHISTEVQEWCVEIAIMRSSSSPSASLFLTSVMIGSASVSLKEASRIRLYRRLPVILHCVTARTWHLFLERNIELIFKQRPLSSWNAVLAFLKGVNAAMKIADPPADVVQILYIIVAGLFNHLDPRDKVAWDIYCQTAWQLPDDILDQMPVLTNENCFKMLVFRCSFVAAGKQPLTWLNDCIDVVATSVQCQEDMGRALMCIIECFRANATLEAAENIEWFLEFMGHLRNVISGHSSLPIKDVPHLRNVFSNLFLMFAAAVIGCSRSHFLLCCWMQSFDSVSDKVLRLLPVTLGKFVSAHNWTPHIHKVVDFLIAIVQSLSVVDCVKQCSKGCIFNLREFEEFKKPSVWTRVIDL